jgi:hypothetical protein
MDDSGKEVFYNYPPCSRMKFNTVKYLLETNTQHGAAHEEISSTSFLRRILMRIFSITTPRPENPSVG